MDFSNVKMVNYKNNIYSVGDLTIEQVFTALDIKPENMDMYVEGDTLSIFAKTGSKGAMSTDVDSSVITKVAFVNDKLVVAFKSGAVYEYPDATVTDYNRLVRATSVGKYFNEHIAPMTNYTKLR